MFPNPLPQSPTGELEESLPSPFLSSLFQLELSRGYAERFTIILSIASDVVLHSLKYSLPTFLVFMYVSVRLLSGRSYSHRDLSALFFLSILAFPLSGIGLEMFLNGMLDTTH